MRPRAGMSAHMHNHAPSATCEVAWGAAKTHACERTGAAVELLAGVYSNMRMEQRLANVGEARLDWGLPHTALGLGVGA